MSVPFVNPVIPYIFSVFLPAPDIVYHFSLRDWADRNVINLKRPLNGKQNVWKYQNGEEKSDSDGREKDV